MADTATATRDPNEAWLGEGDAPPAAPPEPVPGGLDEAEAALAVMPGAEEWERLCVMARVLSAADNAPAEVKRKPADVLLILLTARDLEIPMTDALRTVQVVKGRVTLAPRLKMALVERKGLGWVRPCSPDPRTGQCPYCGSTTGCTDTKAVAHALVTRTGEMHSYTFTIADAERAKLVRSGQNGDGAWITYPQRMLSWRACGYLTDDVFPGAAIGIYTPDEMGAVVDAEGNMIDVLSVEVPTGFERPGRGGGGDVEVARITADEAAELKRRVYALPEEARPVLAGEWAERELDPVEVVRDDVVTRMRAQQLKRATALVQAYEARAKRGEWEAEPPTPVAEGTDPPTEETEQLREAVGMPPAEQPQGDYVGEPQTGQTCKGCGEPIQGAVREWRGGGFYHPAHEPF